MIRRAAAVAEDTRDTDTELRAALDAAHARVGELTDQLDLANARADREKRDAQWLRESLRDAESVLEMLEPIVLPMLAAFHPGFDEPIPDDARVTKAGKVMGTWPPVAGDLGEHYGTVEPVDFQPLYELIDTRLPTLAEVA